MVKDTRLRFGLSQEEFAKKLGVSQAAVSAYENGRKVPTKVREKIAGTFAVRIPRAKKQHVSSIDDWAAGKVMCGWCGKKHKGLRCPR